MTPVIPSVLKFIKSTPNRSFLVYPVLVLIWEYFWHGGRIIVQPAYIILMIWGFVQYRLCGKYRTALGGGGPGVNVPPERLVTSGIYRYTRNPMYLSIIIFLVGLALTLQSHLAGILALSQVFWFHYQVCKDERRLLDLFGDPYLQYMKKVKRWVPGLF